MQFMILGGNDCHGVSCMKDADNAFYSLLFFICKLQLPLIMIIAQLQYFFFSYINKQYLRSSINLHDKTFYKTTTV